MVVMCLNMNAIKKAVTMGNKKKTKEEIKKLIAAKNQAVNNNAVIMK
mgnify:CR=1 FL=1